MNQARAVVDDDIIRCTRCHGTTRAHIAKEIGEINGLPSGYRFCVTCAPIAREEFDKFRVVTRCPEGRRNLEEVAGAARRVIAAYRNAPQRLTVDRSAQLRLAEALDQLSADLEILDG